MDCEPKCVCGGITFGCTYLAEEKKTPTLSTNPLIQREYGVHLLVGQPQRFLWLTNLHNFHQWNFLLSSYLAPPPLPFLPSKRKRQAQMQNSGLIGRGLCDERIKPMSPVPMGEKAERSPVNCLLPTPPSSFLLLLRHMGRFSGQDSPPSFARHLKKMIHHFSLCTADKSATEATAAKPHLKIRSKQRRNVSCELSWGIHRRDTWIPFKCRCSMQREMFGLKALGIVRGTAASFFTQAFPDCCKHNLHTF